MKNFKINGRYFPSNHKLVILLSVTLLSLIFSCSKDYLPKQFPPVKSCPDMPVVMYGGEEYPTVQINKQCWMAKNLNIGVLTNNTTELSNNNIIEKYCYNNDSLKCSIYGGLYQWNEAMQYSTVEKSRGICPEGWHIPSNRDIVDLIIYADNYGPYLIENSNNQWIDLDYSEALNATGFSALPAGYLWYEHYFGRLQIATFWSSRELNEDQAMEFVISRQSYTTTNFPDKSSAISVRCIKDLD